MSFAGRIMRGPRLLPLLFGSWPLRSWLPGSWLFGAWLLGAWLLAALASGSAARAQAFTPAQLVDGFERTVFGSEYGLFSQPYLRRFERPVRVHVAMRTRILWTGPEVRAFVRWLSTQVPNLTLRLVDDPSRADLHVHLVDRTDYAETVRAKVYGNPFATVRGCCLVRAVFTRAGISRADAVIVADEGEPLMRRCMGEEIMQGLGPLNDDRSLARSMFNDTSPFTQVQRFDLLLLAMLYDPRLQSGMTPDEARPLLPAVARRALRDVPSRLPVQ